MKKLIILLTGCLALLSCSPQEAESTENNETSVASSYWDYTEKDDQFTGGVNMIPIETPKGTFNVWTKRMGNNPKMRILLLHGGPGMTHEAFECFDGYFPAEEIEYIYYDQLG